MSVALKIIGILVTESELYSYSELQTKYLESKSVTGNKQLPISKINNTISFKIIEIKKIN